MTLELEGWLKLGGYLVTITAFILTTRHMVEKVKLAVDGVKLAIEAVDQRTSAIGSKLDNLRVEVSDEKDRLTQCLTEQRRDQQEITRLRDARHDYIDKDLNPRLMRFENNVEEEVERFGARMAVVEALVRGGRDA